jgi:hypothetical protein
MNKQFHKEYAGIPKKEQLSGEKSWLLLSTNLHNPSGRRSGSINA